MSLIVIESNALKKLLCKTCCSIVYKLSDGFAE